MNVKPETLAELRLLCRSLGMGETEMNDQVAVFTRQDSKSPPVYIVRDNAAEDEAGLIQQIDRYGYRVSFIQEVERFVDQFGGIAPGVLVLELDDPRQPGPCIRELLLRHQERREEMPLMMIGNSCELSARLAAVRCSADAYFVRPIASDEFIDHLDRFLYRETRRPYRVLLVDGGDEILAAHAQVLAGAGMDTRAVASPLDTFDAILDFHPEIILLNLQMSEVSGEELAAVIRQQEHLVSVPIVFFAPEGEADRQIEALSLGGDDFLVEPLAPQFLIDSVSIRVERYRILRRFMNHDGLTGLLNHTRTKERLDQEVARARRQGQPLSFAMIDLDHFKTVNDRWGHAAGDRVLKNLARLLRQRLRQTDVIGRYGGEEFAVILIDASAEQALMVMDNLRELFSALNHQCCNGGEFFASFSCGVASFPKFGNAVDLANQADGALYEAKRAGRNRVVMR